LTRILVTGGAGYIGSIATVALLDAGFEVNVLDDCSTGHRDAVDSRATFINGSILDKSAIQTAIQGCQAVMHFAGKSLVGESVKEPQLYLSVNVEGSANLLDVMKELGVLKIVFSSSASTYGEPEDSPITEDSLTQPTNPYGLSKLKVDELLSKRATSDGIGAISLRYFNVAGAMQTESGWLGERHDPETHLIPLVLHSTKSEPIKIFGTEWPTPDKTCIRDYIHVVDLVEAHIKALSIITLGRHEVVNLGSGEGYSVRQVIDAATRVVGSEIPTVEVGPRSGDPAILIASIDKARNFLGWQPTRTLDSMISDAIAASR